MGKDRMFEPSWIDRFNNRADNLPIRYLIIVVFTYFMAIPYGPFLVISAILLLYFQLPMP
jgi:hypothetical protein